MRARLRPPEVSGRFERTFDDSRHTSQRLRELVSVLEQIAHPPHAGFARIESVVGRSTPMSATALDQIDQPVRDAAAVLDARRSRVEALTPRWTNEWASMDHINGGEHHV